MTYRPNAKYVSKRSRRNVDPNYFTKSTLNAINDDVWFLDDPNHELILEMYFKNWRISRTHKRLAKHFILEHFGGYRDARNRIDVSESTFKGIEASLRWVFEYAIDHHSGEPLSNWSLDDIVRCLRERLKYNVTDGNLISSSGTCARICSIFINLQVLYLQGLLPDGIECQLPKNLHRFAFQNYVRSKNISYAKWKKGGKGKTIPMEIGMLLLADCLKFIREPQNRIILSYFEFQRTDDRVREIHLFTRRHQRHKRSLFDRVCAQDELTPSMCEKAINCIKLKEYIETRTGLELNEFPFKTHLDLQTYCHQCLSRCLIILLCLTGARISEILSIKGKDTTVDFEGSWQFSSNIYKTNSGIPSLRSISGAAAEAFDFLMAIGYQDKEKLNLPLFSVVERAPLMLIFSRNIERYHYRTISSATLSTYLKSYYGVFAEKRGRGILLEHPSLAAHQFRHLFVEFAIRRFDGNVLEQIRAHFCHLFGSYFTRSYSDRKLALDIERVHERAYAAELVMRICDQEIYFGPVTEYIRQRVSEIYTLGTLEEIERHLTEFIDDFARIVPHEWGWCMLVEGKESQAACYDKTVGLPRVDDQASFDKCITCRFRLASNSQVETYERMYLTHSRFAENTIVPNLAKCSKKAAKRSMVEMIKMGSQLSPAN